MTSPISEVRACIAAHQMLIPGAPVVVGVSGGPDSLCLLHMLMALREELGITLHVAHLDHKIRGAESAAEARFVADLARQWGLPATVEAADVPDLARQNRANLHAAARAARYDFLARVARAAGAQAVAVAHHAGDQAETMLLHMLRGAGPEGLSGMQPVSDFGFWILDFGLDDAPKSKIQNPALIDDSNPKSKIGSSIEVNPTLIDNSNLKSKIQNPKLIRPLLTITREAIEQYCAEHGLEPRYDSTNLDLSATRNRIRHDLLPRLIEYNPHVVEALGRTAALVAEEHAFVRAALDSAWPALARERDAAIDFDGLAWQALHPALQREAIRRAHAHLTRNTVETRRKKGSGRGGATLAQEHVEQARALIERGVGRRIDLPDGVALTVGYGGAFTIGAASSAECPQLPGDELPLPSEGRIALGAGWAIEVARVAPPPPQAASAWEVFLDAEALDGPLLARRRRPGERLRPAGGRGSRRLQDLFVDAKVPRALREAWPVVATPSAVIWVVGLRAAEGYLATPASQRIVAIRVIRNTS